jgi:hypothetical protein
MVIRITSYQLDIDSYRCPADQEGEEERQCCLRCHLLL